MDSSLYQSIKLFILHETGLSRDAIHIHLGLFVFLLTVLLWRRKVDWWSLLPTTFLALVMEALDLRDDITTLGHFRWSASFHDLLNGLFWPIMAVLVVWSASYWKRHDPYLS